jgi:hypothetical protein
MAVEPDVKHHEGHADMIAVERGQTLSARALGGAEHDLCAIGGLCWELVRAATRRSSPRTGEDGTGAFSIHAATGRMSQ